MLRRKICCPLSRSRFVRWLGLLMAFTVVEQSVATASDEILGPGIVAQALAPRSGPRGKTMFVKLSPDITGVRAENNYDDPEMWGKRSRELEIGAIGTGVAIGDYDNDGRPDLFIVSKTGSCRLYHNLGDFHFEDVTEKAGVADIGDAAHIWKNGVTFADVNNDGLLDIYVCRSNAPNLLYINQGDGTFKESAHAYGLDVKDACVMAAFCDYDRDGWLDVFIQTNVLDPSGHPEGQRDYLFHNNRDGTFTDVSEKAGIATSPTHGNSAVWWDFDNDGWPDLYVANDFAAPDALYRNNHDGTFTNVIAQVLPHVPYSAMGSDLADINNDGRIDFMVADMAANNHFADQRTMAETRSRQKDLSDDSADLPQYQRNTIFLNTGAGPFLEAAQLAGLAATNWTWSVRWEDLDNDGRVDLFVTNGMYREIHNVDILARRFAAENESQRVAVMHASPTFAEPHLAFRNLGHLHFKNVSAEWGLDEKAVSFGAAFGDLDGDGDLDLVYSNYNAGPTLLRNDSDQGHRVIIVLRGTKSNRFGIGSKVRLETASGVQIRELSLARGYMSSSEPIVHFGLGDETQIRRLAISWPSGAEQVFENLPADRRFIITEAAVVSTEAGQKSQGDSPREFSEVSGTFKLDQISREDAFDELDQQKLLPERFNRRGPALAVGDIDGTGQDSVVMGGTTLDPLRVLVRKNSVFAPVENAGLSTLPPVDDGPVLLFDAQGKGNQDLLVTRGGASQAPDSAGYQPQLWLNDGHGHYQAAPDGALPALPISVGAVAAADFDRDGKLDLFIGGRVVPGAFPTAPRSALLINRGGKFEDVTDQLAPGLKDVGMVTAALWSDVDGDGWPDLLVAIEWGEVRYFHNDHGKKFEDWTEKAGFASAGNGWWRSLASGDFNGDGKPDYVVGNVGLNTQYHADAAHPAVLFAADFSGGGTTSLIEAYYEGETLYPWRSRRDLASAVRGLLRKFPKNDVYARASLAEIVGAAKLDSALRLSATELRSGIFLSQPDGRYRFEPLPEMAQISPLNGIVVADFDGDGNSDIYAVQNSFAPAPVVGRFDGGLSQLLRGDGHGHFTAVPVAESGLIVPGDAKAVAVLDLNQDGWPDLIVTRNNARNLVFVNHPSPNRHSVRIQLRGPVGNPTAVGAVVTAFYEQGQTEQVEIFAGSGYYSQSASGCFFGSTHKNPLQKIVVHWPSGLNTQRAVATNESQITLSAPQNEPGSAGVSPANQ